MVGSAFSTLKIILLVGIGASGLGLGAGCIHVHVHPEPTTPAPSATPTNPPPAGDTRSGGSAARDPRGRESGPAAESGTGESGTGDSEAGGEYPLDDFYGKSSVDVERPRSSGRGTPWEDVYFEGEGRAGPAEAPRRSRAGAPFRRTPRFFGELTLAGGPFEHDTQGSGLDDETGAVHGAVRMEGVLSPPVGLGIRHEFRATEDDLFEGLGGSLAASRGEVHDTYAYLLLAPRATPEFRAQVRIGPYFDQVRLDEKDSTGDVRWRSVGLRFELEPEAILHRTEATELTAFADLSAGAHRTRIRFDAGGLADRYDGDGATLGLEAGLRLRYGTFSIGVSYLYRSVYNDRSDPENGAVIREVRDRFRGIAIGLGARF